MARHGGWPNVVGVFDKSCPKQRVSHADFSSGVYVVRLDPGSGRERVLLSKSFVKKKALM